MESVISEIIKMDRKAKTAVEDAKKLRDNAKNHIQKKEEEIYSSMVQSAQKQIEQARTQADSTLKTRITELEQKFAEAERDLDLRFKQNVDKWVSELFKRTISS